jgi:hypothetical protein
MQFMHHFFDQINRMESVTDPATPPTDQISSAAESVIEKGSDYVVSHADVVIDKVSVKVSAALGSKMKNLLRSALKSLGHMLLGCITKKLAPAPAPAPSTSSAPASDEPPALELSPDAV